MKPIWPKLVQSILSAAVFSAAALAQVPSPTPIDPPGFVSRERKEQAYTKLMEGQRYLWKSNPMRSPMAAASNTRLAKTAFQKAVELDPTLAEGYTALAEIALSSPPNDIDDAINLSILAIKIEPDNFGGHRILARLYTFKSHLNVGIIDKDMAAKAVSEWKEVTRLDPRNAEAWAFLSEFYFMDGKYDDQIAALRHWVAASVPLDTQFYRRTMGGRGDLSSERASIKLGTALVAARKEAEAVRVLSEVIADDADNVEALLILQDALDDGGATASAAAMEVLAPTVYANPTSIGLVNLYAQVYAKSGQFDEAVKVLRSAAERIPPADRSTAAALSVSLGDLYASNDHLSQAVAAYEKALAARGIKDGQTVADADREFVMQVFDKMIKAYKTANRLGDVKTVIERARKLLGKDDLFADRQVIALFRETGRRQEALAAVRSVRARFPDDYGLLRLESSVLAESGLVDQGVSLIRSLIGSRSTSGGPGPAAYDDFTNYLFVSHLYNEAKRTADAKEAADQAYKVAGSEERRQLAKLSMATSQQMSGDFDGAEMTLREILKQTPRNPIALNNLGYFLLERNVRINEALELIQKAIKIDPTNPSYLDSLGWANFILGNFDEAERNLRMAVRLDSSSGTIREHLGDLFDRQGKAEQATSAWQRALDLATDPADIKRLNSKLRR